jgi:predicted DNA-binding transcriptional regulator YafY
VYQGKPVNVRIWFSSDAAGYIKEKIWHDTQEIVLQKDGSIVFEAEVAGTEEIKYWVMSRGSKAEVLDPQSLREEIRAEAEAAVEKYSRAAAAQEESATA